VSRDKVNERINMKAVGYNEKKSLSGGLVFVFAIVIVSLVGVILYMVAQKDVEQVVYNNVVTADNVEEVISQLEEKEKTPPGAYEVTMNVEWFFENADSASTNAYVANNVSNQNTVYFTIALESAPDEVIYTSPYLAVGSHLEDIKLDASLAAGTHDAIITYHLVDEEFKELSVVSLYMQIIIKN